MRMCKGLNEAMYWIEWNMNIFWKTMGYYKNTSYQSENQLHLNTSIKGFDLL